MDVALLSPSSRVSETRFLHCHLTSRDVVFLPCSTLDLQRLFSFWIAGRHARALLWCFLLLAIKRVTIMLDAVPLCAQR